MHPRARGRQGPSVPRWLSAVWTESVIYPLVKRAIDLIVALGLLVLLAPLLLVTAAAVKLTSSGPVFFIQTRGGRHGRPFKLIKFRTMYASHVHDIHEIVPLGHPAITPLGRILRRLKIDELPQLFNVLKGEMSLVGPRPTIMEQIVQYNEFQRRRLLVRPGCTGLAQVNATAEMSWDERIRYDVYYVEHIGPLMDLMILGKTVLVLLLGESRFARPFDQSPYARRCRWPEPRP